MVVKLLPHPQSVQPELVRVLEHLVVLVVVVETTLVTVERKVVVEFDKVRTVVSVKL